MSTLDAVLAGVDTTMTADLKRLFLAAGCDPACHACGKKLRCGVTFKLVPWKGTDEMCCVKCGAPELEKRDKKLVEMASIGNLRNSNGASWGGFSRPSKDAK